MGDGGLDPQKEGGWFVVGSGHLRARLGGLNLLSNGAVESFWDALWLGIQPFFRFNVDCRRIEIWRALTI